MSGTQADVGCQRASALKARRVPKFGDEHSGSVVTDAGDSGQQLADLVLLELAGDLGRELFNPFAQCLQIFARVAYASLVSWAVLAADRDFGRHR
jgi:hypothetical protein